VCNLTPAVWKNRRSVSVGWHTAVVMRGKEMGGEKGCCLLVVSYHAHAQIRQTHRYKQADRERERELDRRLTAANCYGGWQEYKQMTTAKLTITIFQILYPDIIVNN